MTKQWLAIHVISCLR